MRYNTGQYNTNQYNAPSSFAVYTPVDMEFYRTNVDGQYVFHWGFTQSAITPLLSLLDFELELDTSPLFTSAISYTSATAFAYQDGNVRKGFEITVTPRMNKVTQTWYARVRSTFGVLVSSWSSTLTWTIVQRFEQQEAENLVTNLPDFHVYGKEDLLKPVSQRNTNLYTVMDMYATEFDQVYLENFLTSTNNYFTLCRDEQLFQNFGIFFKFPKSQTQVAVEYRECIEAMIQASLEGSTIDAIKRVIRSFTGVDPILGLLRNREDFFLSTMFEIPPETPDGIITFFSTVDPDDPSIPFDYVPGSLMVLKNGLVLTSGVDFTEVHTPIPGFNMTVAPGPGTLLQVEFDLGLSEDPQPIVFDPTDTTPLTGTLSFTNGSTLVTGAGTLFTTELVVGDDITDASGVVIGTVDHITSNVSLTLTEPWAGDTGSGSGAVLVYPESVLTPPILWDMRSLADGLVIEVLNPGEFTLDQAIIEALTRLILPAYVLVYFQFI